MKSNLIFFVIGLSLLCSSASFAADSISSGTETSQLLPYTSDICSWSPDGSPRNPNLFHDCCVIHDVKYWIGGSAIQRKDADGALYQCVLNQSGSKVIADLYYYVVRMGGVPNSRLPWEWGYGWNTQRGYFELATEEIRQAHKLVPRELEEYLPSPF
jgi:hypothetical protein